MRNNLIAIPVAIIFLVMAVLVIVSNGPIPLFTLMLGFGGGTLIGALFSS